MAPGLRIEFDDPLLSNNKLLTNCIITEAINYTNKYGSSILAKRF